jgi:16S rRNA (cytosine967-C5)-methyltransferase
MRLGGRIAAAIEILGDMQKRHRPAAEALKDWGKNHRFAGSADRHAIGTLVYDSLRKRNSLAYHMQSRQPRALVLATLRFQWNKDLLLISAAVAFAQCDYQIGQVGGSDAGHAGSLAD